MESTDNFPDTVRCIYERLKDDGIYLLGIFFIYYFYILMNKFLC